MKHVFLLLNLTSLELLTYTETPPRKLLPKCNHKIKVGKQTVLLKALSLYCIALEHLSAKYSSEATFVFGSYNEIVMDLRNFLFRRKNGKSLSERGFESRMRETVLEKDLEKNVKICSCIIFF